MRGGQVIKACSVSVGRVPGVLVDSSRGGLAGPLDVPLAAGRTWVPGSCARTAVEGICVRPLAVVRGTVVRPDVRLRKTQM